MTLEKDLAFFKTKREEWLKAGFENKWLVIVNGALDAHFDTSEAAYEHAIEKGEPGKFLIRQLRREENPESVPAAMLGVLCAPRQ